MLDYVSDTQCNPGISNLVISNSKPFSKDLFFSHLLFQSFQVDLMAKSEIFDGAAAVSDAPGINPLGVWEHAPPGNFEKWK